MLPPVQTVSSTSIAFQDRSDILPAKPADAQVQAVNPVVRGTQDLNPAIAARLNILMLSGHEQMAGNVAFLADMVGQAIGLVRKNGESNSAFAQRFIEALAKLTPQERIVLERLLSQAMTGIKLRLLTDAFRNPAGPEAAKLAVHLEVARHKERDLATRTVVTSYRQNGGDPKAVTPGQQMPATRSPLAGPRTIANGSEQPRLPLGSVSYAGVSAKIVPASADEMSDDNETLDMTSKAGSNETGLAAGDRDTGSEMRGTDLSRRLPTATAQPASRDGMTEEPASTNGSPEPMDDANVGLVDQFDAAAQNGGEPVLLEKGARALQERLRQTFEAGARSVAPQQAQIGRDGAAPSARGGTLSPSPLASGLPDATSSARQAEAAPTQAANHASSAPLAERADRSSRTSEPVQTLFVLKGWKEVIGSTAAAIEAALSDHAASLAEKTDAPKDPQRASRTGDTDGVVDISSAGGAATIETHPAEAPSATAAEDLDEDVARAAADEAADNQNPTDAALTRDEELAVFRSAVPREGIPLPIINYLAMQEFEEPAEPTGSKPKSDDDDGAEEDAADQQRADDGTMSDDGGDAEDQEVLTASGETEEDEATIEAPVQENADADRANDLYWRMAGWS